MPTLFEISKPKKPERWDEVETYYALLNMSKWSFNECEKEIEKLDENDKND